MPLSQFLPGAGRRRATYLMTAGVVAALLAGCSTSTKQVAKSPFLDVKLSATDKTLPFLRFMDKTPGSCMEQLQKSDALFIPLPDSSNAYGCGYKDAVLMIMVGGTRLTRPAILRCPAALSFTKWMVMDVQPAAQSLLGTTIERIKVSDHYSCRLKGGRKLRSRKGRRVRKVSRRRMSEHAFANAIDISRMWFGNGRESHVMLDWHGPMRRGRVRKGVLSLPARTEKDVREGAIVAFWRTISQRACDRFTKVLTPEFNWLHRHHIHLDLSPGKRCALDGTVAGRRYTKRRYRSSRRSARRFRRSRAYASGWRRIRATRRAGSRRVYTRVRKQVHRRR